MKTKRASAALMAAAIVFAGVLTTGLSAPAPDCDLSASLWFWPIAARLLLRLRWNLEVLL
jgi:hypothetical protein